MKPIPVMLDTDLGDDIDDIWALSMLLRSPELCPLLVNTEYLDTHWRAAIAGKCLEQAARADIPISAGPRTKVFAPDQGAQRDYLAGYDFARFPGRYREDGVDAMIETVKGATDTVTIIAIAPSPALAAFARRAPELVVRCRLAGMFGSVDVGYAGASEPAAEWNVKAEVAACRDVMRAPWKEIRLTPLDTCGLVVLEGERYDRMAAGAARDPLALAVLRASDDWSRRGNPNPPAYLDARRSSVLYDTVAVHLAFSTHFLNMETIRLRIDDEGFTRRAAPGDADAFTAEVALSWSDREGYLDYLIDRLLAPVVKAQ